MSHPSSLRKICAVSLAGLSLVASVWAQTLHVPGGTATGIGDNTANGNIGIGTASPFAKLHALGGSSYVGTIVADAPVGGYSSFGLFENGSYKASIYWHPSSAGVFFYGPSAWVFESGNVGIGTTSPTSIGGASALSINATGADASGVVVLQNNGSQIFRVGTLSGWASVQDLGSSNGLSLDEQSNLPMRFLTNAVERMRISAAGNVGIGTSSPSHKLAVNGTIRAKEVIVDTGWADYVFADDYRLAPLAEVEAHIREKKHLPGIPSAAEVEAGWVSLGDMQSRLLAKVEELTLHVISQNKQLEEQRQELAALKRAMGERFP